LENIPVYMFRVWLCVKNSYLRKRMNEETPQFAYPSKEQVISKYNEIMSATVNLTGEPDPENPGKSHYVTKRDVMLPRSLTLEEARADIVGIFDACLSGKFQSDPNEGNTYFFNAHRHMTAKDDFEYLTTTPLLVYNLGTGKFERAEVQPLWKDNEWARWVNCR
jgi:hypothetical protein